MSSLGDESVDLVVTSPPYPMIEMWDQAFAGDEPGIIEALEIGDGPAAFERMHLLLDRTWRESTRVLRNGGFICINIGDATRKVATNFRLYTNHSRITSCLESLGMQSLPAVLWRKQTNAPNKFMGSGMLPSGAYVTLEHEYILIFRKGDKREFKGTESAERRASAFFWEERNTWFSDIWDFKGTRQMMGDKDARSRSAAFPFELPYRLINMYSLAGDTVLDPFFGTGTTSAACLVTARNSVGYETVPELRSAYIETMKTAAVTANEILKERLDRHIDFVARRTQSRGTPLGHVNKYYEFPVMTRQEVDMVLYKLDRLDRSEDQAFTAEHSPARPDSLDMARIEPVASNTEQADQLAFSFKS